MAGRACAGVRNGSLVPQQNMMGAAIWPNSPADMTLSARQAEAVDRVHERSDGPGVAWTAGSQRRSTFQQLVRRGRGGSGAESLAEQPPVHAPRRWAAQHGLSEHPERSAATRASGTVTPGSATAGVADGDQRGDPSRPGQRRATTRTSRPVSDPPPERWPGPARRTGRPSTAACGRARRHAGRPPAKAMAGQLHKKSPVTVEPVARRLVGSIVRLKLSQSVPASCPDVMTLRVYPNRTAGRPIVAITRRAGFKQRTAGCGSGSP